MSAIKIIILASGNGTNAQALMDYAQENPKNVEVVALISDKEEANALKRADKMGIPSHFIAHKNSSQLLQLIDSLKPDWAFLAGYMRIMPKKFLQCFWNEDRSFYQVMNIHPSLLPDFPGLRAYERSFESGHSHSGITVHLVDEGIDTGRIILQSHFKKLENDSFESFEQRGRKIELKLFPMALELAAKDLILSNHETILVEVTDD